MAAIDPREARVIPANAGIPRRDQTDEARVIAADAAIQRRDQISETRGLSDAGVSPASALLAAALALPGVAPSSAGAQTVPETGLIQFMYTGYRDWQPGRERMTVKSPALYVMKPIDDRWVVEGGLVYDGMSGASPRFYDALSGATITEYRTAGDAKVTRYFDRFAVGVGAAYSRERDYVSRAVSVDLRFWSPDKNTTWALGIAGARDSISPVNLIVEPQKRNTVDLLAGVTQSLSPELIVQSNITYSIGHGYFSDPYKTFDTRPRHRRVLAWLTRANRHFAQSDGTLEVAYRYVNDSFGDDSHMVEVAWHQPLPYEFAVRPNVRYLTQSAANFFFDPPFPNGFVEGELYTADARLSAFGGLTAGFWLMKRLPHGWSADFKYQFYRQKGEWRLGGGGTPGLLPFSASWFQLGVAKTF